MHCVNVKGAFVSACRRGELFTWTSEYMGIVEQQILTRIIRAALDIYRFIESLLALLPFFAARPQAGRLYSHRRRRRYGQLF